jgi:hypothetical protein
MRVDLHTYRPELCASPRTERPHLAHVWLEIDSAGDGRLVATDSYIACSIPVQVDARDRPGPIPVQAFKDARMRAPRSAVGRGARRYGEDTWATIDCRGTRVRIPAGRNLPEVMYTRPRGLTDFPDIEKAARTMTGPSDAAALPVSFGVNPQLAYRLGQALGCNYKRGRYLRLELTSSRKAIRVSTNGDAGEWGILMPVRID